ncbi:DUF885 domain-containing protein [Massilia violaceinigra]|uniref:DUF885 domain-containing protein n=1 Tax=Massilia violaceinigra TaxID=2045208 RepID=A0A2D2DLL6_9BURK|nr:DUF885 domain-containing protein [Massilia violaceinigra]ATQ75874.1 DUF885 domain-containing protein [Massilia violaceinigra]
MRLRLSRPLLGTTALLAVLMSPLAPATAAPSATTAAATAPARATKQLHKLADAFYQARARFDPLLITANGDSRYNGQLGLSISQKNRTRQFDLYRRMQTQLKAIPRARLSDKEQLNYDLLAFELESGLSLEKFPEHLLPLNHFDHVPGTLANYASGTGSQPLNTVAQYQDYLSRLNQLPAWIDQAIANMREGVKRGIVQPKAITVAMLPQFQQLRSATPEANIFYTPVKNLPAAFSQADKDRLSAAYRGTIANKLSPALDRLATYVEKEYLPASRNTDGWSALADGAAWYQAQIKDRTTVSMNPEEIHQLGLKEVARIQQQWAVLGPKLGYSGPPAALPQWVAAQDKFKPFKTEAEVLDAYRQIDAKVRGKLAPLFSLLPKAPLELQLEPELSRATASDHYTPAAADGSHPGVFWAVVTDPKQYSRTGMVTLYLHEGQPGHHFHAGLLKELDVPDFRKFNTENPNIGAFTEGWALYAETLGHEFGLYDDPEAYFGHLNDELLRAVRLVVDTGMHVKGWNREQAIAYARETLGYSEARAKNQIERYMVWPAQALSYKIGALKILELRERARKAMGDKFSLPKFHEVVIGDGTLPLPLLEARVDRWIASAK